MKKNPQLKNTKEMLDAFSIGYDDISFKEGIFVDEILVDLSAGEKISKVESIKTDLCRELKKESLMVVNDFSNGVVSLQIPKKRPMVLLENLIDFSIKSSEPSITIGLDMKGNLVSMPIKDMVHMLVCGATKSGKSVFLRSIIQELSFYNNLKFVLIDPKFVEFSHFSKSNKLLYPVLYNVDDVVSKLDLLISLMNERYMLLMKSRCVNIQDYNNTNEDKMDYIVVVCDELADLMAANKKGMEDRVSILAAKSRAVGIHLILATQRASTDVITGKLKVNLTTRACFRVPTQTDSRVVLDTGGAESLCGKGDGLLASQFIYGTERFQGAFIDADDLVVQNSDSHMGKPAARSCLNKTEQHLLDIIRSGKDSQDEIQRESNLNASSMFRIIRSMIKNKVIYKDGDVFKEI